MKTLGIVLCAAVFAESAWAIEPLRASVKGSAPEEAVANGMDFQETIQTSELAAKHGVEEREIRSLRVMGMGWGEVDRTLGLAGRTGRPVSEIVDHRETGMGWEEIAERYGMAVENAKPEESPRLSVPKKELRDSVSQPAKAKKKPAAKARAKKETAKKKAAN